jgi:hypothetical protein
MARIENSPNFVGEIVDVQFSAPFHRSTQSLQSSYPSPRCFVPALKLEHAVLHRQCRVHGDCSDGQSEASLDKIVQLRHLTASSNHTQHPCEAGHTGAGPEASQTGGDGSLLHKTWGKIVSDLLSGCLPPATCISTVNQIRDPVDRRRACTRRTIILQGHVTCLIYDNDLHELTT